MIIRDEIVRAHQLIAPYVRRTPTITVEVETVCTVPVILKLELLQHTGSFKARGAFANLLEAEVSDAGVAAASGGNHGAAVAYAARALGYPAHIFVPEIASPVKIALIRDYGAKIIVGGTDYAAAAAACDRFVAATGAFAIHPYDAAPTLAATGTIARELEDDAGSFDTMLVAVGGGGLIGGVASWLAGRARVIAVETEGTPTLSRALAVGQPVDVDVSGIAADSLGAQQIGALGFAAAQKHVVASLLVGDQAVRHAQRALWRTLRLVAEPGGATALAALTGGAYRPLAGERIAVIVCGANADPATVA